MYVSRLFSPNMLLLLMAVVTKPKWGVRKMIQAMATCFACACVPTSVAQERPPKEIVQIFCKLDAEGRQLSPEGQKDMAALLYEQRPWAEPSEITVVKDYVVRAPDIRADTAQVIVEYNVWGRLDSSFRFARLAGLSENHPTLVREYVSMIRSDKHLEWGSDGQWQEVRDVLQWRIRTIPSSPHVSASAAMRYVQEMGQRSRDPMVKRNAQAAFANLTGLLQDRLEPSAEPRQSPAAVLSQFVALETDGKGLSAEGRRELDALLVQPATWRTDKIHVARGFVVSNAIFMGAKGILDVEYTALGDLDSSLHFSNGVHGGGRVREGYTLALSNKYSLPGANGKPAQELIGPSRWKVADSPPEQWITLNTAIRYVTEMRDRAADPVIKTNAEQTLAKLMSLH